MTRADLIKALNWITGYLPGCGICEDCPHERNCYDYGCAILRDLKDALETPPWIPVEEDEPPTNTTLLLSVRDPDDRRLYTTAGWKGAVWYHIFDMPFDPKTITHWMPLPEPPEMEAE